MKIMWERDSGVARCEGHICEGHIFAITSEVRNELNGRRRRHVPEEVVNVVQRDGRWEHPYMPRPFPKGAWKITGVEKTTKPEFAPVKIKTDAHQQVELWNLDGRGGYDKPGGVFEEDYGYHPHWSERSRTTLGCGRVGLDTSREVLVLAELICGALAAGEDVILEVA